MVRRGQVMELSHGEGAHHPQYVALDLASGYLRMNPGPPSGWGTSVVLLPSYWSGGAYHQGGPLEITTTIDGEDAVVALEGAVGALRIRGTLRIHAPARGELVAELSLHCSGQAPLDARPGEAFKPVLLSSMRISDEHWDAHRAWVDQRTQAIPPAGWIVEPPGSGGEWFGLDGGTSRWKANAPTIEIFLAQPLAVSGWVTASVDPNDDNVAFWAASDHILDAWRYTIVARRADGTLGH